jgi:hypothetical protein
LDANTLRKSGENAISADRAANALQILAEFPELAVLVESWQSLPESERNRRLPSDGSIK